jgi:hypothetical protein
MREHVQRADQFCVAVFGSHGRISNALLPLITEIIITRLLQSIKSVFGRRFRVY